MKGEFFYMDNKTKAKVRAELVGKLFKMWKAENEDVGMITSNSFNFPIVAPNGEEGWAKITLTITNDEDDMGYMERDQYNDKVRDAAARKAKAEAAKAAKIKKDEARRAQKLASLAKSSD